MSDKNSSTAKERLSSLEEQVRSLHESNLAMATISENQRLSIVELADKMDALIYLVERDAKIDEKTIADRRRDFALENMKKDISDALDKGALIAAEVVGNRSFIVVEEKDKDGKVIQPRAQVAIINLPEEIKNDFIGLSKGAIVKKEEVDIELQEIYDIADLSPQAEG